ncbi:MAG: hypothetical protein U1A27_07050 [Phycisphaerae bacterium]
MIEPRDDFPANAEPIAAVVAGLQEIVSSMFGRQVPITATTRIDRFIGLLSDVDALGYLDLAQQIEDRFGVRLSAADWSWLTGGDGRMSAGARERLHGEQFTFGRLAERIVQQARLQELRPLTILGARSHAAGAFRWLEEAARQISPRCEPFAPSTPIRDRFRNRRLKRLWGLAGLASGGRVQALDATPAAKLADRIENRQGARTLLAAFLVVYSAAFVALAPRGSADVFHFAIFGMLFFVVTVGPIGLVLLLLTRLVSRAPALPGSVQSFGDLARLIAGERGGWCAECGYDLTGVRSGRCPECGVAIQSCAASQIPQTRCRAEVRS